MLLLATGILAALVKSALIYAVFLPAGLVVIVVYNGLFDGPLESAADHSAAHAEPAHAHAAVAQPWMAEAADAVQHGLYAFKRQRAGSHARGRLHGSAQKARLAGGDVLRLRVLRVVARRRRRRRSVGLLLRWNIRGLRRSGVTMAEQVAEKAGGMGRLLARLLHLLLQLRHLRPGLVERDVLDQNRLRQNVQGVGVGSQSLVQQALGIGVFFLQLCLVYPLDERADQLFFLGSHAK